MLRFALPIFLLAFLPSSSLSQEEVPPQEATHEVAKGETLWSLAERYYGNPYRWPIIFQANADRISDPDVLEPGQLLLIPRVGEEGARVQVQEVTVAVVGGDTMRAGPPPTPEPRAGARPSVVDPPGRRRTIFYPLEEDESDLARMAVMATPEGRESVQAVTTVAVPLGLVYGAEWLEEADSDDSALGTISGRIRVHVERTLDSGVRWGETVLVRLRANARLEIGDLLQSYHTLRRDRELGFVQAPTGILVVTQLHEDGVEAVVSEELGRIAEGDRVRRAPDYLPVPGVFPAPVESNVSARVLGFPDDRTLHGYGARVFLDVGAPEGIVIGDVFRAPVTQVGPGFGTEAAELQVILLEGRGSTARIIDVTRPDLQEGAVLRLIGKMHGRPAGEPFDPLQPE